MGEVEDLAAVWGIMMEETDKSEPVAQKTFDDLIGKHIHKVVQPGSTKIPAVNFASQGSLTSPPFAEVVLHIVFRDPIEVSKKYMDQLRGLGDLRNGKTEANYRAIQPLNDRKIFWSC